MRRLLVLLSLLALFAAACGGSDDGDGEGGDAADAAAADDSGATAADDPTTTAPSTTATIPPQATAIPDLQIVFVEFGDAGYVEIANRGDEDADVTGIQLCQFPTYVDLGTVVDGATIAAGESVQIPAATIGGLRVEGGEAALYAAPDFTNPDAIFGFVQWGTGGERSEVAAEAGIWPSGASVEPDPAFNSIELFGDPADPESWS